MTQEYTILVEAAKELDRAKLELAKEEGGSFVSPAFRMLCHAQNYLMAKAESLFRGEAA